MSPVFHQSMGSTSAGVVADSVATIPTSPPPQREQEQRHADAHGGEAGQGDLAGELWTSARSWRGRFFRPAQHGERQAEGGNADPDGGDGERISARRHDGADDDRADGLAKARKKPVATPIASGPLTASQWCASLPRLPKRMASATPDRAVTIQASVIAPSFSLRKSQPRMTEKTALEATGFRRGAGRGGSWRRRGRRRLRECR